jgi:hypothetical protein
MELIPYPIIRKALKLCASMVGEKWPDDDWITLDEHWDINLFRMGSMCKADIAPVSNGVIKSELGCTLIHFRAYKYETKDITSHE